LQTKGSVQSLESQTSVNSEAERLREERAMDWIEKNKGAKQAVTGGVREG